MSSSAGNGDDTGDLSAIMMSRLHAEFLDLVPDVTIPASLLLSESNKYTLVENEIKNSLMETLPSNSDRNGAYLSGMTVPLGESHALKDNICDTLVMHVSCCDCDNLKSQISYLSVYVTVL